MLFRQDSQGNSQLYFFQGETYKTIDLTVRNDSTPETHEVFVVELSNIQTFDIASTGQATFIPGKTTATVSISASDRPHGVIELEAGSRLVDRTDEKNFTLTVSRLFGNIGKWELSSAEGFTCSRTSLFQSNPYLRKLTQA